MTHLNLISIKWLMLKYLEGDGSCRNGLSDGCVQYLSVGSLKYDYMIHLNLISIRWPMLTILEDDG